MYTWDDEKNEFRILSTDYGLQQLIKWCDDNLEDCHWGEKNSHGNDRISIIFRFSNKEDAMAFKLTWS